MITEETIRNEEIQNLMNRFSIWLKEVRLSESERNDIKYIIEDFSRLSTNSS